MNFQWDIIGQAGLEFFGKISASISHEIKNALATINENAGLLEDYTRMAEKGMIIDSERLKTMTERIVNQIRRADEIVGNMNRFAHSVDSFTNSIELGELVVFMVTLAHRFSAMRGVILDAKSPLVPVTITTSQFLLENLIWLCLDFAMNAAGDTKRIGLAVEASEKSARLRFTGLTGLTDMSTNRFPTERERALLSSITAELSVSADVGELVITLPREIV